MPTVHTVSLHGLTGHLLTLTATVADGPPAITLTGGRDHRELRDRVHAALANSGKPNRHRRVEVHLDLPESAPPAATVAAAAVAVAAIAATTGIALQRLAGTAVLLGDVGLDGTLRPTLGVLPAVQVARAHGIRRVIVPAASLAEAALVDGVDVLGAHRLAEIADWLRGNDAALQRSGNAAVPVTEDPPPPVRVLPAPLLRAVEVAAAGGHHILLDAVDGTLLAARWLHQLLPDLTPAQQLEVAAIQSLTGTREHGAALIRTPPMAIAHYSGSPASLVGGVVPGAVSQAHHGLLVADDLDELTGAALDALHFALLQREVRLARAGHLLRYPARFQLFATCHRSPSGRRPRLAPHLLDVIDVQLRLSGHQEAMSPQSGADNWERARQVQAQARKRVADARARAAARWRKAGAGEPGTDIEVTNAAVPAAVLHAFPLSTEVVAPIHAAVQAGALSRRGATTVLRLAWTAAGLDGAASPSLEHVEEALGLRHPPTAAAAAASATELQVR